MRGHIRDSRGVAVDIEGGNLARIPLPQKRLSKFLGKIPPKRPQNEVISSQLNSRITRLRSQILTQQVSPFPRLHSSVLVYPSLPTSLISLSKDPRCQESISPNLPYLFFLQHICAISEISEYLIAQNLRVERRVLYDLYEVDLDKSRER